MKLACLISVGALLAFIPDAGARHHHGGYYAAATHRHVVRYHVRGLQPHAVGGVVLASWYHEDALTATGERFNPDGLTAAHRSLPFGTRVRVTNIRNGRSVVVRINDRGPAAWTGKALDLSRGAASVLDFISAGVTRVMYRILG